MKKLFVLILVLNACLWVPSTVGMHHKHKFNRGAARSKKLTEFPRNRAHEKKHAETLRIIDSHTQPLLQAAWQNCKQCLAYAIKKHKRRDCCEWLWFISRYYKDAARVRDLREALWVVYYGKKRLLLSLLLDNYPEAIEYRSEAGSRTLLFAAVERLDIPTINLLLERNACTNVECWKMISARRKLFTPLCDIVSNRQAEPKKAHEIMKLLIAHGADVNAHGVLNPLQLACTRERIELLVDHGSYIDTDDIGGANVFDAIAGLDRSEFDDGSALNALLKKILVKGAISVDSFERRSSQVDRALTMQRVLKKFEQAGLFGDLRGLILKYLEPRDISSVAVLADLGHMIEPHRCDEVLDHVPAHLLKTVLEKMRPDTAKRIAFKDKIINALIKRRLEVLKKLISNVILIKHSGVRVGVQFFIESRIPEYTSDEWPSYHLFCEILFHYARLLGY